MLVSYLVGALGFLMIAAAIAVVDGPLGAVLAVAGIACTWVPFAMLRRQRQGGDSRG
ncbi:hypothetical protein [Actinoplanes sp. NPDC051859]|uniref:hypothetical protein n=1 Tax=Actinoplanes sp. NPDC051859 TaxID=3363909 RepID=UPI0037B0D7EC